MVMGSLPGTYKSIRKGRRAMLSSDQEFSHEGFVSARERTEN